MQKQLFKFLAMLSFAAFVGLGMSSCASSAHCPGTGSTGTLAKHKARRAGGGQCSGTTSTGTKKMKYTKKKAKEDGLFSPKMRKTMAKNR